MSLAAGQRSPISNVAGGSPDLLEGDTLAGNNSWHRVLVALTWAQGGLWALLWIGAGVCIFSQGMANLTAFIVCSLCFPVFGFMSSMYCYTKSCKEDMPLLLTCLANLISFFMLFGLACVGAEKPDGSDGVTIVAVASMLMSGANAIAIVACLARYNEITRTLIGDPGDADTYVLQKHESILRKDDQMRISFASTLSG